MADLIKKINRAYSIAEIVLAFITLTGFIYLTSGHPSGDHILRLGLIALAFLFCLNAFLTIKQSNLNYLEQGYRLLSNFGAALCCFGVFNILIDFPFCSGCMSLGLWFMGIYFVYFIIFRRKHLLKNDLRYNLKIAVIFFITLMVFLIYTLENSC